MAVNEALLADAKNYLDITYTDTAVDSKLTAILLRGQAYLDGIAEGKLDYDSEGIPKEMLFEYARYVRSEKPEQFLKDWAHGLHRLKKFGGDSDVFTT
jgi:hypothetical protein